MVFEIGKYYRNTAGEAIHILCQSNTHLYGQTLIAERIGGNVDGLVSVESKYFDILRFFEITPDDWQRLLNSEICTYAYSAGSCDCV
jgi:hypothetical protein